MFDQQTAQYAAQLQSFDQKIALTQATIDKYQNDESRYRERLRIASEVESMRSTLAEHGNESRLNLLGSMDAKVEALRTAEFDHNSLMEAEHQIDGYKADREAFVEQWLSQVSQDLVTARNNRDAAISQLEKAAKHRDLVRLVSPERAIVLALAKGVSAGSVLKEGDTLMTLAPLNAPVEAEIEVASRDVGFARVGDPVTIKIDAFNFAEHGTVEGVVKWISEDAFTTDDNGVPTPAYYRVRVTIDGDQADRRAEHVPARPRHDARRRRQVRDARTWRLPRRGNHSRRWGGDARTMSRAMLASCLSPSLTLRRASAARQMNRGEAAYAGKRFISALRRWRAAWSSGSSEAAFRIAELYVKGEGVQRNLADAVKWYRQAAEVGHEKAQFRLGLILLNGAVGGGVAKWASAATARDAELAQRNAQALFPSGFEVKPDPDEALRWLNEAARNGVREADEIVGTVYLNGHARPRDFGLARQRLELAAEAGVASAQFRLGDMLYRGLGTPSDPPAAADWYERAAAQGHPRAAVAIGSLLMAGQGRAEDRQAAGAYFEKAAETGDAQALYRAGLMRLSGDGLPRNLVRAESYLRHAAKMNDLPAILALAEFYSRGAYVEPDFREAYVWYRRAAELGDGRAQFIVARLCATGVGVVANAKESALWFLRSAEKGDPIAAHNVACLYARGDGVEKDAAAAAKWFRIAAEKGVADSQVALARAMLNGELGARDAEAARTWLEKAIEAGSQEAKVSLAALYHDGTTVPRDSGKAERLLQEAAEAGFAPAARSLGNLCASRTDHPAKSRRGRALVARRSGSRGRRVAIPARVVVAGARAPRKTLAVKPSIGCDARPQTDMRTRHSNSAWPAA